MERTTKMKTMRMDVELIGKISSLAEKENRNFTNMVETILKKEVNRLGI